MRTFNPPLPAKYRKYFKQSSEEDSDAKELVINLKHCKYPLIHRISTKEFNLETAKSSQDSDWDILWADSVSKLVNHPGYPRAAAPNA